MKKRKEDVSRIGFIRRDPIKENAINSMDNWERVSWAIKHPRKTAQVNEVLGQEGDVGDKLAYC